MSTAVAVGLEAWYSENARMFSFRETAEPYRILVTEMLLRQTRAQQVEKVYAAFFRRYPTLRNLAAARHPELQALLRPLGLTKRSSQLIQVAKIIEAEHHGRVPQDSDSLRALPGVGEYVAGCVLTHAYGIPAPAIDTNVRRVLSRVFDVPGRSSKGVLARLTSVYGEVMGAAHDRRKLHYAIIDLASSVCRPRNPQCAVCCLSGVCDYPESHSLGVEPQKKVD